MITHFSHRFAGLFSSPVVRVVTAGAAGIWLSLNAANAPAQSMRPYQMTNVPSTEGSATVDIPIFHYQYQQPTGRSIVWLDSDKELSAANVDWTRIVAVYVDEPYNVEIAQSGGNCDFSAACDREENSPPMVCKRDKLRSLAAAIREKAPSARFWVNFHFKDIDLILDRGCAINESYIDVISMDEYGVNFSPDLSSRYQRLYNNRATPYQQLALIPGTFTGGNQKQTGRQGVERLPGFFAYASSMNQHCDLPLGPMGRTGIYDGCPVWMVAGWLGGTRPHADKTGPLYYPIDHEYSAEVANAWRANFAIRRVDPARARQAIKAVPLLLNDE